MKKSQSTINIYKLTFLGLMTALVVVLQLLGSFIHFGRFSVSLVLVPIVVGGALLGPIAGGWLGLVFGAVVLLSGDAADFLTINFVGTIITVLLKGTLAGFASGLVYKLFSGKHSVLATFFSAIICPIINTAVFMLGCYLFFFDSISKWASGAGKNMITYIILFLVGANFIFEFLFNLVLSPVLIRLIQIGKRMVGRKELPH